MTCRSCICFIITCMLLHWYETTYNSGLYGLCRVPRNFETFICGCRQQLISKLYSLQAGLGEHSRYSDLLQAGWSRDPTPEGVKFSTPIQNGPGAHPDSCTMGTGSFPGVKWPGRSIDYPPPSRAEV